jgi:hypothetical protein
VARAHRLRRLAREQVTQERVLKDRDLAVQHRHVDELPAPRPFTLDDGRQDADRREQSSRDIA